MKWVADSEGALTKLVDTANKHDAKIQAAKGNGPAPDEGDDEVERLLVGSVEERGELEVLTPGSPLGVALMGAKVGDIVDFEAPGGVLKVEIVAIEA
jgi:transcription elongation GreA/GreB family factor